MTSHPGPQRDDGDERPPILGRWSVLYAVVIGALALQVLLYYLLTSAYAR
ncbi:MAG: hypothetical protein KC503_32030 [Myxococcales bacterium]|nr:hypothetical protein [Myxococcales bacterium]